MVWFVVISAIRNMKGQKHRVDDHNFYACQRVSPDYINCIQKLT